LKRQEKILPLAFFLTSLAILEKISSPYLTFNRKITRKKWNFELDITIFVVKDTHEEGTA
jgi:hypothetical protein